MQRSRTALASLVACFLVLTLTPPSIAWVIGKKKTFDRWRAWPVWNVPRFRVLVPAYFHPVAGSDWDRLAATAAQHEDLVWAIANPQNGPGATFDPAYGAAINNLRANDGHVLGYVHTSYGARPINDVMADIDAWYAWYAVDGVFLDEMDNTPNGSETYYHALRNHVRTHDVKALVYGNPGTSTTPDYLVGNYGKVADSLCVFENDGSFAAGNLSSWTIDTWTLSQPRQLFGALLHSTPASDWQWAVDRAYAEHVGWIYATDDVPSNPWDTLPAYFEALVAHVATY